MPGKSAGGQLAQIGSALHQRMLNGDPTAPARVAEVFMPLVTGMLRRRYPNVHNPDLVDTAVEDALMGYYARPQQYDPTKSSLLSYLRMSADGDLRNLLRKAFKRSEIASLNEPVELEGSAGELTVDGGDDFDLEALVLARNSPVWHMLSELLPDAVDQEIVLLMMEGVRDTEAYADVLEISHCSADEQRATVKRHKDRLKKKLQRGIDPSGLVQND